MPGRVSERAIEWDMQCGVGLADDKLLVASHPNNVYHIDDDDGDLDLDQHNDNFNQ